MNPNQPKFFVIFVASIGGMSQREFPDHASAQKAADAWSAPTAGNGYRYAVVMETGN
jgi:hypothetical protein